MASTTTSEVELAKIRVPIADCKTFELPAAENASDVTIGEFITVNDCLALALNTGKSVVDVIVCAYDIPKILMPCRGSIIHVGESLGYIKASQILALNVSDLTVVAFALETKNASDSEILVHFNGLATQAWIGLGGSELEMSLDTTL